MMNHLLLRKSGGRILFAFTGVVAFVFCFIAFTASANAATCTFASVGTSDWNTAANWDCGHVPTSTDDVVIPAATTTIISADATSSAITIGAGATLNFGAGGHLNIYGDWVDSGGSLTGAGTQEFTGSASATITGITSFNEFVVAKTGNGGIVLNNDIDVRNNVQLQSGNLDMQSNTITFDYFWNNTGGRLMGSGTVECDSPFSQTIVNEGNIYDLLINKPSATTTLSGHTTATHDVIIQSGGFDIGAANRLYVGGDLKETGGILSPNNYSLWFFGTDPSELDVDRVNTLHIDKSGGATTTLSSDVNVTNNVYLENGVFDLQSNAVKLDYNWYNNGGILAGTGTVELDGPGAQTVSNEGSLYNLLINKSGTSTLSGHTTATHDVIVQSGTLNIGPANKLYVGGDLKETGGNIYATNYSIEFFGPNSTEIDAAVLNSIVIDKSGGATTTLLSDVQINNNVNLDNGHLNLDGNSLSLSYGWYAVNGTISTSGTVVMVGVNSIGAGSVFPNLTVQTSNRARLQGNATATGRVYVAAGELDIQNYTLAIGGRLDNSLGETMTLTQGTIDFYGTGDIGVLPYSNPFGNVRVSKTSGSVTFSQNADIYGNLFLLNSGSLITNDLSVASTTSLSSGTVVTTTAGTLTFNGPVTSTGSIGTNSGSMTFGGTYVNNGLFEPGSAGLTITHNATTTNNGTINQTATSSHVIYNDDLINNGTINTNGKLTFNNGFTNNGTFNALGANQTVFGGSVDQAVPSISMDTFRIDKTTGTAVLGGNVTTTVAFDNSSSTLAVGNYTLFSGGTYANTGLVTVGAGGRILHRAAVMLTNNSGTEVASVTAPGNIFVTVTDGNVNMDGTVTESFSVTVTSASGDTETVNLTETGPSTGIFRNSSALPFIQNATVVPANGQITSGSNTTGSVSYTDSQDASDAGSDNVNLIVTAQNNNNNNVGGGGGGAPLALPPAVDKELEARLDNLDDIGVEIHDLVKLPDDGDIETQADRAVYYVGEDGRRHAFPNAKVYFTWYENFEGVVELSMADLASIPLGRNVTYKPGVRMVKFMTDPKVYAVSKGGVLHWIMTEDAAIELYGEEWNQNIDDISDAFYLNYIMSADDISGIDDYDPAEHRASVTYPSDSLQL